RDTFALNLAAGKPAKASNTRGGDARFAAAGVNDGKPDTYWAADDQVRDAWVEIDLGGPATFDVIRLREQIVLGQRVESFAIEVDSGGEFREVFRGSTIGPRRLVRIPATTASRVRVRILQSIACPTLAEIGIFKHAE
ncbi:MAG: discoidin domain-containing protein, partial [Planctomycetes bacterium]|nr:discoidin domain-containing protein [Planctomycetota bacterium]